MSADNEEIVVIDDEDDDEDDQPQCMETNDAGSSKTLKIKKNPKKKIYPTSVAGYTKPSYSFPMIITQALALCKKMQATAMEICDIISQKYPYYKYHPKPEDWRGSVFSSLTNRRKFFVIVGVTGSEEYIWSFNPTFENYMLNKWVPKYLKKKEHNITIPTAIVSKPVTANTTGTSANVNLEHLSPVIVSCETLKPQSDLTQGPINKNRPVCPTDDPKQSLDSNGRETAWVSQTDLDEPEYVLADPEQINEKDTSWEYQTGSTSVNNTVVANKLSAENEKDNTPTSRLPFPLSGVTTKGLSRDFTLDNLHFTHVITSEEISYRLHFNKEHPTIKEFRLHCTVCDVHLGTAPVYAKENVRFHSNLGVLTCKTCYDATTVTEPIKENHCLWCMKQALFSYDCTRCTVKFCKVCIRRNFGSWWTICTKKGWECFFCDTKQIWPHRAIAYFLFRHYGEHKRKMNLRTKSKEVGDIGFWVRDESTCCSQSKDASSSGGPTTYPVQNCSKASSNAINPNLPTLPKNLLQQTHPFRISSTQSSLDTTNSVTVSKNDQRTQQTVVIGKQFPNQVYVESSAGVPSVTLNTGTQYIHNVYPDHNYVVVQPSVSNQVTASSIPTSNTYTSPYPTVSKPVMPTLTPQPPKYEPTIQVLPQNDNFVNANVPSRANVLQEQFQTGRLTFSSVSQNIEQIDPNSAESTSESNICIIRPDSQDIHIVPDDVFVPNIIDTNEIVTPHIEMVGATPYNNTNMPIQSAFNKKESLSVKERIVNRPMPKSKKESLLKSLLLVNQGTMKAMKQKVQASYNSPTFISCSSNEAMIPEPMEIDNTSRVPVIQVNNASNSVEEPILKSIIESAMERLANLQKTQTPTFSPNSLNVTNDTSMVASQETFPSEEKFENRSIPKIKIKTLKELQQSPIHDSAENENNNVETNKEPDRNELNIEIAEKPKEVNITGLKQGIIESSRTLISTQKKFKELAKMISSKISYKPEQAVELVTKFQNILKSCRKQIDGINKNVQKEYGNIMPQYDLDSILKSIKASEDLKVKQLRNNLNETGHEIILSPWHIVNREESGSCSKRNRDFVHINPLQKKNIVGTPEITEEDLQQFPDSTWELPMSAITESESAVVKNDPLTKKTVKKNALLNCYKKREVWYKRKKKTGVNVNKNGVVIKRKARLGGGNNELSEPIVGNRNARKSAKPFHLPSRLSSRNHPSTAAYSATYSAHRPFLLSAHNILFLYKTIPFLHHLC